MDALDALAAGPDHDVIELVPSARSVRITADREGLRRLAADQLGLPTAPFWFVGSVDELKSVAAHAGYPLLNRWRRHSVVAGPEDSKPPGSVQSGLVQVRCIRVCWLKRWSRSKLYVTLLAVRSDGPDGPVIEFCAPIGHRDAAGEALESWQPQKMSAAAMDAAKSIAARAVKALGGRGVFGIELMINGDEVYFAGVTAGPGDSAWVTACSQRLSVFELQARAILSLPVDTVMISPGAARVISPGHAPSSEALTRALSVPESDVQVFGPHGGGVALATGPDLDTARNRAQEVATALNVPDSRG